MPGAPPSRARGRRLGGDHDVGGCNARAVGEADHVSLRGRVDRLDSGAGVNRGTAALGDGAHGSHQTLPAIVAVEYGPAERVLQLAQIAACALAFGRVRV